MEEGKREVHCEATKERDQISNQIYCTQTKIHSYCLEMFGKHEHMHRAGQQRKFTSDGRREDVWWELELRITY